MVCPLYVWMPPVHTQPKESMLCQTKGVSICPMHLGVPCMLGCPIGLNAPSMFGCPICLDGSCMFGCPDMPPCMFGCRHMFGCPLYAWTPP